MLQGRELFGKPAMNMYVQMIGKFALFVPVFMLLLAALGMDLSWIVTPGWVQWLAVFVFFIAMLYLSFSLVQMGEFTKMGLPLKDEIKLQTDGIYSLSRNPMYFGLFLLAIASLLYVPNPINLLAAIVGVAIHHLIIKREEQYLQLTFGQEWFDYKSKVRRYL
jgi:protein-S-isoprenylcysteine O-methyltransferase Ste14